MNFNVEEFLKVEGQGYTKEQEQKDLILNQVILDELAYTTAGLTAGLALSIFFKRKIQFSVFTAGIGAGLAFQKNSQYLKF